MDAATGPLSQASAGQKARRRVNVVPHTHWDREWYASFQSFRLRLVDLLDDLLPRMEDDPSYARFLLDGQLAVVDDYLAVRPDQADRLRRLVGSGRVAVGPWYTLPDEFLVSGETLVRNLQLGLRTADAFGGAMTVGYLPDMFGHVAQMPQILRGFGFEHAVVWRGTPAAVDRSAFWWQAPDGTTLRAEYLPDGYGNGSALPDDAKALLAQVAGFEGRWGGLLTGPILWMNGTDHQVPRPWLGRVVAEADAVSEEYEVRIASLAEHLATAPTEGLPTWRGELRSGARANLLMGVTSNRVDVRRAAARAERALERAAEPLSALYVPPDRWPAALLGEAWRHVVRNAAHDSVCACSIDDVVDAVLHRYSEAADIGEGLAERALSYVRVAAWSPPGEVVVANPVARARSGLVEVRVAGAEAPAGTQLVRGHEADVLVAEGPPSLVLPAVQQVDWLAKVVGFTLSGAGGPLVTRTREGAEPLVTAEVHDALNGLGDAGPLRLVIHRRPEVKVLARVDVPGFGWATWRPGVVPDDGPAPVTVDGHAMGNGLVRVDVDPTDGTFALDGHRGLGRLVDGGDCGDTYNWCPPADDTLVDRPDAVTVDVVEAGPLRARLAVTAAYRWPARSDSRSRAGEVAHEVRTVLELRAGEAAVRVEVTIDNRSRDHRLRAHFPLPRPADRSHAECAYAVVERGLEAEGGPTEAPLPTYPAQRFVTAGGLTVVHDGVTEYELVDIRDGEAHELAITLLRSTGMLSQGPMTTRPLPAGPLTPIEGPQLQRVVTARYAVAVGDVDPYALADDVLVPLVVDQEGGPATPATPTSAASPGEVSGPRSGTPLTVEGAEVAAVVREGVTLRARVFNPRPEPTTVTVEGRRGWLVDLRGRPLSPFDGALPLAPWSIATLALPE
jgi:mannosylglycerate hydrolase